MSVFLNPFKAIAVGVLEFSDRVANSLWPAPAIAHANHLADFEAMIEVLEPRCGTCHQELGADGECAWERLVEAAAVPAAGPLGVDVADSPPAASPEGSPLEELRDKVQAMYDAARERQDGSARIALVSVLGMLDNLIDGPGEPGGPW